MPMYKVTYASLTARYGPKYISADSEWDARKQFQGNAFSSGELSLIKATEVSDKEMSRALHNNENSD